MTESESPGVADEAGAEEPDQDSTGSENIEPANVAPATAESPPDGAADDEPDAEAVAAPARAPRSNRAAFALIAVAVVALIGVNVVRWATGDSGAATDTSPTSAPVATGALRPSFELTDVNGNPYDFASQTRGQLTFLFFGYTNCPDICPIQMATLTAALSETPDVGSQIVFVTTDPARDTPDRLKSWLANFQRPIIGLTGTPEAVAAAQKAALVTVAIAEPPGSDGSYTVGHAASVLVYGPDDTLVTAVPSGTTQGEWMDTIRGLTTS